MDSEAGKVCRGPWWIFWKHLLIIFHRYDLFTKTHCRCHLNLTLCDLLKYCSHIKTINKISILHRTLTLRDLEHEFIGILLYYRLPVVSDEQSRAIMTLLWDFFLCLILPVQDIRILQHYSCNIFLHVTSTDQSILETGEKLILLQYDEVLKDIMNTFLRPYEYVTQASCKWAVIRLWASFSFHRNLIMI
jgi:hypothetical protein